MPRGWHHSALEAFLSSHRTYEVLFEPPGQLVGAFTPLRDVCWNVK